VTTRRRRRRESDEEDDVPVETNRRPHRDQDARDSGERNRAERISRDLESRIGPHKYQMWFGHAQLRVKGGTLEVATDSTFVAKWIDIHFAGDLAGVAREELGKDARIDVRVAPERFESDDPAPADRGRDGGNGNGTEIEPPPARRRPRRASRPASILRALDEFVVGRCNRLAYSTARRLLDDSDAKAISPLFIHGDCGVGKTHLLQGICRLFAEHTGRPDRVRYVTGEQFTNEFITAVRNDKLEEFRRAVRRHELLAIDDVHFLSNKMRTQSEVLHTLDAIDLTGERTVLASDEHPRLIKRFSPPLVSRFLAGMVVEIERPDRETRAEIVQRLVAARGLRINTGAVEAIVSRCVGSVRELEGAVTKLTALHALAGSGDKVRDEIGLLLVDKVFGDQSWKPSAPIRIGTVVDVVCAQLEVSRADLMGSSRNRKLVLGRGLASYLGREMTTHSYPEIGRALGRSFHSTIHAAEQRVRRLLTEGADADLGDGRRIALAELVDQLRHEITRAAATRS
jgi:chromosomal replication initiator protein